MVVGRVSWVIMDLFPTISAYVKEFLDLTWCTGESSGSITSNSSVICKQQMPADFASSRYWTENGERY